MENQKLNSLFPVAKCKRHCAMSTYGEKSIYTLWGKKKTTSHARVPPISAIVSFTDSDSDVTEKEKNAVKRTVNYFNGQPSQRPLIAFKLSQSQKS